ncbi:hypothetical protein D3P09_00465 [Paenibacillus pinisoli]|uniref:Uncharacterized protein n=1 Tax=Paenibacillus pinisoli TaxID=1276110 RepID=A0A3A6PUS8_9BACL|nr:hypothetical protein [Paenibacillus pinisoli]RJX40531.1 hypothetical protein D3P09_00465 [Paenibacillus pinisoli]
MVNQKSIGPGTAMLLILALGFLFNFKLTSISFYKTMLKKPRETRFFCWTDNRESSKWPLTLPLGEAA